MRPRQNSASGLTAPRDPSHLEEPILCEVIYFTGALGLIQAALGGGDLSKEVYSWGPALTGEVIFQKKKRFIYKLGFTFIHKCYCASYYGILTNPFLWEIGLEILNNYKYFDLNLKHCEV